MHYEIRFRYRINNLCVFHLFPDIMFDDLQIVYKWKK